MMAKTGRFVPARRSVAESPAFLDASPPEHNVYFLDLIRTSNKVFVPRFERYKRLEKVFEDNFQFQVEGKITVEECVAKIARDVDRLIKEVDAEKTERVSHSRGDRSKKSIRWTNSLYLRVLSGLFWPV